MCESVHKSEKEEQVKDEGEDDKMQIKVQEFERGKEKKEKKYRRKKTEIKKTYFLTKA
jgi:hypothetical protein